MSKKSIDSERARVDRIIRIRLKSVAEKRFLKRMGCDPISLRPQGVSWLINGG